MKLQIVEKNNETAPLTLEEYENVIGHGLSTFLQVGTALLWIKSEQLYLENYPSFEVYCRKRWAMTRGHAYRLLTSATVAFNLSPIGDTPTHESQVRPLFHLPVAKQQEVWAEAIKENHSPTATQVKAVIRKIAPECQFARRMRYRPVGLTASKACDPDLVTRCRALIELAGPEIESLASQFVDRPDIRRALRHAMGKLQKCWAALEEPIQQAG